MHCSVRTAILGVAILGVIGSVPVADAMTTDLLAVGTQATPTGGLVKFYASSDSGASWTPLSYIEHEVITYIAYGNDSVWAPSQGGRLYRSRDGGKSWENTFNATDPACTSLYMPAFAPGGGNGFIVCDQGPGGYRTQDGGNTWVPFSMGSDTSDYVDSINFVNATHGVATVSIGPAFYTTTDGGATWTRNSYAGPNPELVANFGAGGSFNAEPGSADAPLALLSGSFSNATTHEVTGQFVFEAFGRVPDMTTDDNSDLQFSSSLTTRGMAALGAPGSLSFAATVAFSANGTSWVSVNASAVDSQVNGVFLTEDSLVVVAMSQVFRAPRPSAAPAATTTHGSLRSVESDPGASPVNVKWTSVLDAGQCELYSILEVPAQ